ncbi:MAG: hypothetical protein CMH61_02860 [Nanoarchaeota archaeon]|nr:hypothetical protein [Nanoarchaeota archaeon]|tara:strand:+ start:2639 stop:3133 length:495 start_codon:yes stop_codon:yes gene_type:complete
MPLAVTHVILTIVLLDIFRHYVFGKDKFPRYLLIIGGIAGLAPDLDIPLGWLISLFTGNVTDFHGIYTHSYFFPVLFLVIAGILHYKKNIKWANIFYVVAAGWTLHLPLDCLFGGIDKNFVWPLSVINYCPQWGIENHAHSIDAIILVFWLVHEEVHNKIKDYF